MQQSISIAIHAIFDHFFAPTRVNGHDRLVDRLGKAALGIIFVNFDSLFILSAAKLLLSPILNQAADFRFSSLITGITFQQLIKERNSLSVIAIGLIRSCPVDIQASNFLSNIVGSETARCQLAKRSHSQFVIAFLFSFGRAQIIQSLNRFFGVFLIEILIKLLGEYRNSRFEFTSLLFFVGSLVIQTYQFSANQSVIRLHGAQLEKYILSSSQIASFFGRGHVFHEQIANFGGDRRLVLGHFLQFEQNIHSQICLIGLNVNSNKLAAGRFGKRYRIGFFPALASLGCVVFGKVAIAKQSNGFKVLSVQFQSLAQTLTRSLVMAQFQEI